MEIPKKVRQAIGACEAAALMGVHRTRPAVMAERGELSCWSLDATPGADKRQREYVVYDGAECEKNYQDYAEGHVGRPRSQLHLRGKVLDHLATVKHPIAFEDAIGVVEAAQILKVHRSFVPRLVANGEIVGRVLWSPEAHRCVHIVSKASCEANVAKVRSLEKSGLKQGRRRRKK